MELSKYKLGEVAEILISSIDKKTKDNEPLVKLCNFVDVYHNWAITSNMVPSFMEATANKKNIEKFSLKKGYVAITKDSETRNDIGIPTYISEDLDNTVLGYHCALIKPNDAFLSGKYLNVFLNSDYIKRYFELNATGSGMRYTLSIDTINNLPLLLPPIEEQNKIGEILSNIDRKLQNNREINQNLEAMAKQLYDYWFVQFDFPNEDGKPYKSSGGKMVWNTILKREIPDGWVAKPIGEIESNIITGKTPSCSDESNFGGDIPFITIEDIRGNLFVFKSQRTLSAKGAGSQAKKYLPVGSLSVSCIGTIGVMGYIAKLSQTNQQINSIIFENDFNRVFIYYALKMYFENTKAKTGNVFANMSKEEFSAIKVVYPPKNILKLFHKRTVSIFDEIKNIINEINYLTKQRDELLPLLMNGQVSVNSDL